MAGGASSSQRDPLARLVRQADSTVASASALVKRTLALLAERVERCRNTLNLAGSAADRETVYGAIRREMRRCGKKIDMLMRQQLDRAGRAAAKTAGKMTGLEVRYSPSRAKAICELVTPAQGENLAAVFTDRMAESEIRALREATVQTLREQAVAGGSLKDQSRDLLQRWRETTRTNDPKFTDASGRTWKTDAYLQMNVRTNSMRVYNDCLVDDVTRATGSDLMRISAGGDPDCDCAAWEGVIVSVSGKTKEFPSYAEARAGGCFHPNCTHTLEYVDEDADADEIARQKAHPVDHGKTEDYDAMDERKYEMDQHRYRDEGMTKEEARTAVDRDNLDAAIRNGLVRGDSLSIVDALTPGEVARLCPDGNPPTFEPLKLTKRERAKLGADGIAAMERWNRGSRGGVVHADADRLTARRLVELADAADARAAKRAGKAKDAPKPPEPTPPPEPEKEEWSPSTPLETATDTIAQEIGLAHSNDAPDVSIMTPNYSQGRKWQINCQRCVPTAEMNYRGYKCTALPNDKPTPWNSFEFDKSIGTQVYKFAAFKGAKAIGFNKPSEIEKKMKEWGDGARAQITVVWKRRGGAHTFFAVQEGGRTRYIDPQTNNTNYTSWQSSYAPRGNSPRKRWGVVISSVMYNSFARIDNLEFTDIVKECCKKINPPTP